MGREEWFQGGKKAYTKERQGQRAAGSEVRRRKKASEKERFRSECSRKMGRRISREAWWRGPCWARSEQMK